MNKLDRCGSRDLPTFIGQNGEITLNLSRYGLKNIDTLPTNINVLILDHNDICRLENLSTLCDLQKLSVADNKLLQLYGLSGLVNLTILNLPNNGITTMDGLKKLSNLRWLNLSGNKLKVIEQLDTNLHLKHLDLSDNYIYNLQDLSHLTKLKTLLLHCNHISTLQDASKSLPKSLEIFSLASNMISNILEVQELSCFPKLSQFSLGNNPCIESHADEYKLFILGWLPNLQILDGTRIIKEDIEKANCFMSELKSPLVTQSSSGNESYKSNEDIGDHIISRNHVHPIRTESITHQVVNHNLPIIYHNKPISSYKRWSTELNQNFALENVCSESVGNTPNESCTEKLALASSDNSCSNEFNNHVFQSFSSSSTTMATAMAITSTPTPNDHLSISYTLKNNDTIHSSCNQTITCTENVNISNSSSYTSSLVNLNSNVNNTQSSKTNHPLFSNISINSPRQNLPTIKTKLFTTPITTDELLSSTASYCNDNHQLNNDLLPSYSVYLPLNVSNTINNTEETVKLVNKEKNHLNTMNCIPMMNNVHDWSNIDQNQSLKSSPSDDDSSLSYGNSNALHHCIYQHVLDQQLIILLLNVCLPYEPNLQTNCYDAITTTTISTNSSINPITSTNIMINRLSPITLFSSTCSITPSTLSTCCQCPTCGGNQTKLLQDHIIFLQQQLQTQYRTNEAEYKLNQLHSNSIQFLLKEVEELKAWKESITLTLTNSTNNNNINKSVELSSNSTQTSIEQTPPYELTGGNTVLENKNQDDNNNNNDNSKFIQHYDNMIEQNHTEEDIECKNNNSTNQYVTTTPIPCNGLKEKQHDNACFNEDCDELNEFNELDEEEEEAGKTLSSFAKMSNTQLTEDHNALSTCANTSKILLGNYEDLALNTTTIVNDSCDFEDFTDLELVRQAALQAMNLDSTSVDASLST
ncbi:unnamed protein product [Schistosoma turkestanicum]|nr:unnamed protein product [Schistosoma turkestanicum]